MEKKLVNDPKHLNFLIQSPKYLNSVGRSASNTNLSQLMPNSNFKSNRSVFSMESLADPKNQNNKYFENELIVTRCGYNYIENDDSDDSFESTDESDVDIDSNDSTGISKKDVFYASEVVWAKRSLLPWFPAIIINPNEITKEIKDLIKKIGSKLPSQNKINTANKSIKNPENCHLILFFNRNKTWMYIQEKKLRPFCKENDELFLSKAEFLSYRYRKQLQKAYEKAKKFAYKPNENNQNASYDTIQHLLKNLLYL